MSKKCKLKSPITEICYLPKIDIKERRKLVKDYLKGFNREIKKAIADDDLLIKIKIEDVMSTGEYYKDGVSVLHLISFTDKNFFEF